MVRTHNEDSVYRRRRSRPCGARRRHGRLQRGRGRQRHRRQCHQQRHAAGAQFGTRALQGRRRQRAHACRRCCCSSRSRWPTRASTRRRRRVPNARAWARRWWRPCSSRTASASVTSATRAAIACAPDRFEQLTHDHSLLQEQIDSGMLTPEQAKYSLNKNLVTRALGIEAVVPPDISEYRVEAEDIYVLCSDGLTDMVDADCRPGNRRRQAQRPGRSRRRADRCREPERRPRQYLGRAGTRACGISSYRRVAPALDGEEAGVSRTTRCRLVIHDVRACGTRLARSGSPYGAAGRRPMNPQLSAVSLAAGSTSRRMRS